ncbi:hypothetical protein Tco_1573101, partial [Tanacetum coccineum]
MDSHDSSPSPSRDWFFPSPSPSFTPRQPRRFSTPHAPSRATSTLPTLRHAPSHAPPRAGSLSSSSYSEVKYGGFRRRSGFT